MPKSRTAENIYVGILALAALAVVVITDHLGMPQKWHAVVVGTAIAFGGCAWVFRQRWSKQQFWLAVAICFVIHLFGIWIVFGELLKDVKTFGILLWAPFAFAEGVLLLALVPALQRKI
jgi:hypothetical protein